VLALVSTWDLAIPDQQRAVADLAMDACKELVFTRPELLSHSCMLGTDGTTLLHYQQWRDRNAAREFIATGQHVWHRAVDAVVQGTEREPMREYEIYRATRFTSEHLETGCVVIVDRVFIRPDREQAERWIDSMFALPEPDDPMPGAIAAHFHLSLDGARVFNFAQWTTEQAHHQISFSTVEELNTALANNPDWRAVEAAPTLGRTKFRRYRPYRMRVR
jgi:hypothetical protein